MKGLATKTIGELIIMVIVVIILGAASVAALPYIKNLLDQYFGISTNVAITEAVKCSYLRCVNGCSDPQVSSVSPSSWPDLPGHTCPCAADFQDSNRDICGFSSTEYPVEYYDQTPSPVLTRTSFDTPTISCIWPYGNSGGFGSGQLSGTWVGLIFGPDTIKSNPGTQDNACAGGATKAGITNFVVSASTADWQNPPTIFVRTDPVTNIIGLKNQQFIYVDGSPGYTILGPWNNFDASLTVDSMGKSQVYLQNSNSRSSTDMRYVAWIAGTSCGFSFYIKTLGIADTQDLGCSLLNPGNSAYVTLGSSTFGIQYVSGPTSPGVYEYQYVLKISLYQTNGAVFFTDTGEQGQNLIVQVGTNIPDLSVPQYSNFYQTINSVLIKNAKVVLYANKNYGNPSYTLTQDDIPDLLNDFSQIGIKQIPGPCTSGGSFSSCVQSLKVLPLSSLGSCVPVDVNLPFQCSEFSKILPTDPFTPDQCNNQRGCSASIPNNGFWSCGGTAEACSSFTTDSLCSSQIGCTWQSS